MTWQELQTTITTLEALRNKLRLELFELQSACPHLQLPSRKVGEEYRDVCPDCGFIAYMERL